MPHLTLLEKGSQKTHRVEGSEVLVGRDPACGIFLEGDEAKTVSGRHARFFFDDAKWYVEDAGSRNGTYVGGRKLEPGARHTLAVGDVIGLGLTGTQLTVREAVGRGFAATMLEAPPVPPPARPAAGGTVPMRMSEAIRAGIHDLGAGEEVRIVLRGVQSGSRSVAQGERVTIGRALECLIRVEGESATSVSRVHSEIGAVNEQVMLRDGGSRHGTFLNGKKIDAAVAIKHGDVLMLGPGGPTFTVDEASIVPAAPPGSQSPVSPPAREPAIGPTGVRPAASKSPQSGADRGENAGSTAQPTPLDQPAYRVPTPEKDQPSYKKPTPPLPQPARRKPTPKEGPATRLAHAGSVGRTALFRDVINELGDKSARRLRTAVWGGVGLFTVVTAAIVFFAKQKMDRTEAELSIGFKQQAAELEAIKTAALNDAAQAKAALDSAMSAAAPAAVLDSLRQAVADADRRSAGLEESLRRARASLDEQLVAADSIRRAAEQDLARLRQQIASAEQSGANSRATMDSMQRMARALEVRAKEMSDQQRAMKGADFPLIAQLNQGAVGMVTVKIGDDVFDGSGFVVSPTGLMLTNRHVIRPETTTASTIYVTMSDHKNMFQADLVMIAPPGAPDVALIRIRNYKGPVIAKVDWTGSHAIQGEGAALIGFPAGFDNAVDPVTKVVQSAMTAGIFAKIAPDRIQYSGLSVKGSSGSPLFNGAGEVVGIHFAGLVEGPGLGTAIPLGKVVPLIPETIQAEIGISR
jgi:pSer/pThr/pTyr-binding forkhead associated (FHA) protein/S1-C subfamily serine protease